MGDYSVKGLLESDAVYRAVINGFPYKSPGQLGLSSEREAFFATKQAIYRVIEGNGTGDYKALNPEGERVLNAIKQIYNIAMNGTETRADALITATPSTEFMEVDSLDGRYKSQTYTVTTNYNIKNYFVDADINKLPTGTKITDINNIEKTTFNSGEQFKLLIPVNESDVTGIQVSVVANLDSKPVFYAESYDPTLQAVALTADPYEEKFLTVDVKIGQVTTELVIEKRDSVTNEPLQNAVFEVSKINGEVIGTFVTDNTGKVNVALTERGQYKILEKKAPNRIFIIKRQ